MSEVYVGDFADYSYARDVAERMVRQSLQVLGPVLAVVAASGQGFDWKPVALSVALAALWTLIKAYMNIKAPEGAPLWRVLLDRVGSAALGTLAGLLPAGAFGLLSADWQAIGIACLGAAGLALISYFYAPPSQSISVRRTLR